jgi:ankyrin repeat protein
MVTIASSTLSHARAISDPFQRNKRPPLQRDMRSPWHRNERPMDTPQHNWSPLHVAAARGSAAEAGSLIAGGAAINAEAEVPPYTVSSLPPQRPHPPLSPQKPSSCSSPPSFWIRSSRPSVRRCLPAGEGRMWASASPRNLSQTQSRRPSHNAQLPRHARYLDRCCRDHWSTQSGNTPIHWAALNGHWEIISTLLFHKADVNRRNKASQCCHLSRSPPSSSGSHVWVSVSLCCCGLAVARVSSPGLSSFPSAGLSTPPSVSPQNLLQLVDSRHLGLVSGCHWPFHPRSNVMDPFKLASPPASPGCGNPPALCRLLRKL